MEPENTKQKIQAIKEIFKDIHDTLSSSEIKWTNINNEQIFIKKKEFMIF